MRSTALIWFTTALFFITGVLTGCSTSTNNLTYTKNQSQESIKRLTASKVIADIQNNEMGHTVSNIQIIGIKNTDGLGVAFASFNLDGNMNYANIFDSKKQGKSVGVFTASKTKGKPIQYTQVVGENGYCLITGVVDSNSGIKNMIIIFSKGQIRQVPVVNGDFWLFGKTGTSETEAFTKQVIGVTSQGNIISNKSY